jgi:hypothetical protein
MGCSLRILRKNSYYYYYYYYYYLKSQQNIYLSIRHNCRLNGYLDEIQGLLVGRDSSVGIATC